jgi:hypothetical protein
MPSPGQQLTNHIQQAGYPGEAEYHVLHITGDQFSMDEPREAGQSFSIGTLAGFTLPKIVPLSGKRGEADYL